MLRVDVPECTRLHMLNDVPGGALIGFDNACIEARFGFNRAPDAAQPCRGAVGFSLPNKIPDTSRAFLHPLSSISYMFYSN